MSDETLYKAIERILDDESAWIARPSDTVTTRIAIAAAMKAQDAMDEDAKRCASRVVDLEMAAEQIFTIANSSAIAYETVLKSIRATCAEILHGEGNNPGYELREFCEQIHGEINACLNGIQTKKPGG